MKGKRDGALPRSKSFCNIDKPNVHLIAMKIAEDEDGIILRLMETEGKDSTVTVTLPFLSIREAANSSISTNK
jgi:alpha-mannosidase